MYKINEIDIIPCRGSSVRLKRHMLDKIAFSILSHIGLPPRLSILYANLIKAPFRSFNDL